MFIQKKFAYFHPHSRSNYSFWSYVFSPSFFPNAFSFQCYSQFSAFPGSLAPYPVLLISSVLLLPSAFVPSSLTPAQPSGLCAAEGFWSSNSLLFRLPDFCIFCNTEHTECKHPMQDLVIDISTRQRENEVILANPKEKAKKHS